MNHVRASKPLRDIIFAGDAAFPLLVPWPRKGTGDRMASLLTSIGQIAVPVQDLRRAEQFYKERLGLRHLFNAPPGLVFFDCNGMRLMLSRPEQAGDDRRSSMLYFTVADIHEAFRTLKERGVPFVDAPHVIAEMDTYDLWMAFFNDSEGNMLAMMCEVPRTARS